MSNFVHPTSIIDGSVVLGDNNYIGPFCRISGPVTMGDNNYLDSYVSIGSPPQDDMFGIKEHIEFIEGLNLFSLTSPEIEIGSGNVFREFVTVHKPTISSTKIGNDCYFMTQSHVPHDAIIQDRVKIANSNQIGGFTIIQSDAYLGLSAAVLQFSVIGEFSMIGMNSTISKNIFPGSLVAGSPARTLGPNLIKTNQFNGNSQWWEDFRNEIENSSIPQKMLDSLKAFKSFGNYNLERPATFNSLRGTYKRNR